MSQPTPTPDEWRSRGVNHRAETALLLEWAIQGLYEILERRGGRKALVEVMRLVIVGTFHENGKIPWKRHHELVNHWIGRQRRKEAAYAQAQTKTEP